MSAKTPPHADPFRLVHDLPGHFRQPQTGWYRLWYKSPTAPYWCAMTMVASVVTKRVRQLTGGGCRELTLEKLPHLHVPHYTQRERKYLTRKGF